MCKHCKNLKNLKNLRKSYCLLSEALDILDLIHKYPDDEIPYFFVADLCYRIKYFFEKEAENV